MNDDPILYIDRDGNEVYIYGQDASATVTALQKTTTLTLCYDINTHQMTAIGAPQNNYDKSLLAAINDKRVMVNLYTTRASGYISKDGSGIHPIVVGAYEGSEIVAKSMNKGAFVKDYVSGKLEKVASKTYAFYEVQTTQIFNLQQAEKVETAGGEGDQAGHSAAHEILESYHGGVSFPGGDYTSSFEASHIKAIMDDPKIDKKLTAAVNYNTKTREHEVGVLTGNGKWVNFSTQREVNTILFSKPLGNSGGNNSSSNK